MLKHLKVKYICLRITESNKKKIIHIERITFHPDMHVCNGQNIIDRELC